MVDSLDRLLHVKNEIEGLRTNKAIDRVSRERCGVGQIPHNGSCFAARDNMQHLKGLCSFSTESSAVVTIADLQNSPSDQARILVQEVFDIVSSYRGTALKPKYRTHRCT